MQSDVSFFHFSDSVVISVPLATPSGDLCRPTSGILDALAAACFMQITSLGAGFTIRGEVEIGIATSIGNGEIYDRVLLAHIVSRAASLDHRESLPVQRSLSS